MKLPAPQDGWRDTIGMLSPGLLVFAFLAVSTDVGLFPALVLGFMMTGVGWIAYVICVAVVCRVFWPESEADHADPFQSRPAVTAAVLLSAFVWI